MASKTHYSQHQMLTLIIASARYVGLLTASPTDAGATTNEVSGSGYARQLFTWSGITDLANGAQIASTTVVTFPAATGTGWGTVTHVAAFDALSGGNMWLWVPLGTPVAVGGGYVLTFPAGNITDLDQ